MCIGDQLDGLRPPETTAKKKKKKGEIMHFKTLAHHTIGASCCIYLC